MIIVFRTLVLSSLLCAVSFAGIDDDFTTLQKGKDMISPTVTIKNGALNGMYLHKYDQDLFLGVPYAQPPVGNLRFQNPQPFNMTWSKPRNATEYSPMCYGTGQVAGVASEDCLTLNVVRPRRASKVGNLPVAVWIHGGGYMLDGSRNPQYNLTYLVDEGVKMHKPFIAVSFNYRLQGWGFLWGSAVKAARVANLGLKDQRLALHWVQENIASFGGDPKKVTIFGESAGGGSVGNQLLAYGGRDDGLFRGAVIQSMDVASPSSGYVTAAAFDPFYTNIVNAANCSTAPDTLECLRQVPIDTLSSILTGPVGGSARYFPVIDGDFIQESGAAQLTKGTFVHVPLLHGQNNDEGTTFGPKGINTEEEFVAYMTGVLKRGIFPTPVRTSEQALILTKLYPDILAIGIPGTLHERPAVNSTLGAMYKRVAAYGGDVAMHAGRRYMAQMWSKYNLPAYSYNFNVLINGASPTGGCGHGNEIAFVFNNLNGDGYSINPFANKPESYKRLAKLMSRMWISFFVDQTPNHSGETDLRWPTYSNDDATILVFDVNTTSSLAHAAPDTYRAEAIAYLQSLYD